MRPLALLVALLAVACEAEVEPPDAAPLGPPLVGVLWAGSVVNGEALDVIVQGAPPGDTLRVYASDVGRGPGPCPARYGGLCLDLVAPRVVLTLTADATGRAAGTVDVPDTLTAPEVFLQAIGGVGAGAWKTAGVRRTVHAAPPTPLRVGLTDPPIEPYTLGRIGVEGDTLFTEVTYSGGCVDHQFLAQWDGAFMESLPEQIRIELLQYPSNDPCDAIVTEVLTWDVGVVRDRAASTPILVHVDPATTWYDFLQ